MGMKSLFTLVSLVLIGLATGAAQPPQTAPAVKTVPVRETRSLSGKDLYREYCAVCHGTAGKGDGPAAAALKAAPANLTLISVKNGGKFPEVHVQQVISGEADGPVAHGSKDMPVWGNLFRHMGPNPNMANVRVHNLMTYIEQMQAK